MVSREGAVADVARHMLDSIRTSPRTKGQEHIDCAIASGKELKRIAEEMDKRGWIRDAENIRNSDAVVLVGVGAASAGLNCGACGYASCAEYEKVGKRAFEYEGPVCAMRLLDLGIALGSAVKIASLFNIDNRIMRSAGSAAKKLGYVKGNVVMGIPLSARAKSIYFDRGK